MTKNSVPPLLIEQVQSHSGRVDGAVGHIDGFLEVDCQYSLGRPSGPSIQLLKVEAARRTTGLTV